MAVRVYHFFQSVKPDGADTSGVRPSNWNEDHVFENIADDTLVTHLTEQNAVNITNATTSTSTTTGALKVAGGVGIAGTINVGGTAKFFGDFVLPKTSGFGIKVDTATPTYPWRDLEGVLYPDPAGVNSPTLAAVRGGLVRNYFYSVNDKMDFAFHIPHDYVPGTDLYIHIHWSHNGTAISGSLTVSLATTYAKGHNQAAFPAEKTVTITYATVNIATTPQYQHRIDEVQWSSNGGSASLFDSAKVETDGMILGTMTVTGIPTITGGSTNEPFIVYIDLHYQSTNIGTKAKAPGFWT